jgi:micrococcal nuclease
MLSVDISCYRTGANGRFLLPAMRRLRAACLAGAFALPLLLVVACSGEAPSPSPTPTAAESVGRPKQYATGKVVAVADGVTIAVEIAGKIWRVRYLGIEVPVDSADKVDGKTLDERARDFNRFRVDGRTVELEEGVVDADAAGLLLRYVYADGEMVNVAMVTAGYAVVASSPSDFTHKGSFVAAQEAARLEQRGYWREPASQPAAGGVNTAGSPGPTPVQSFRGGTLPLPQGTRVGVACDYSGTSDPVIKGNVDARTGERTYLIPGSFFYSTTEVNTGDGDTWFCTEAQAVAAGWPKAKH